MMGKLITTLGVIIFTLGSVHAQHDCPMKLESEADEVAYEQVRMSSLIESNTTTIKYIPVHFHVVRRQVSGTWTPFSTDTQLDDALANLNSAYSPTNIRFYKCGRTYIDNNSFDDYLRDTKESALVSGTKINNVANVYVVGTLRDNVGSNYYTGYAMFPWSSRPYGNQFMIIPSNNMNSPTNYSMPHEFGHFFGLVHTHETYGSSILENVTRTGANANCTTRGDKLCDTPADPDISGLVNASCNYTGNDTDAVGVSYVPDPELYMSYSRYSCVSKFSAAQIAIMNTTILNTAAGDSDRNNLNCGNCTAMADVTLPASFIFLGYVLDDVYRTGAIESQADINSGSVFLGSEATWVSSQKVTLLPGFKFSANDPSLTKFRAVHDPCGNTTP